MELTQKEQREGHAAGDTLIDGGFGVHTHQPRRKGARIRLFSKRASAALIAATAAAITFFPVAATAAGGERQEQEEGGLLRAGNGPGPAANGPGPGSGGQWGGAGKKTKPASGPVKKERQRCKFPPPLMRTGVGIGQGLASC